MPSLIVYGDSGMGKSMLVDKFKADCAAGCAAVTSLMRVHQMMTRRADQVLAPLDLTFARYELLVRLYFREGSLPLNQLGKELQIHQTSITSLVDRLEKQGLIKRTPRGRAATAAAFSHLGLAAPDGLGQALF